MNQPSAAQTVQQILSSEQQLLARRGAVQEQLEQIDRELTGVRAAIQGIQLGQQLVNEAATPAAPDPQLDLPLS